jgi:serine/threonine-protein kinase RsbW
MLDPTYLIPLDTSLSEQFLAAIEEPRHALHALESPRAFFDLLSRDDVMRAVVVAADARRLDPCWFREVHRRAPESRVLGVCRECSEETWRRLLLAGAAGVLRPPWDGIVLESELSAEPSITHLFRRHPKVRTHGKLEFGFRLPSDPEMVTGVVHVVSLLAMEFGYTTADFAMNLPLAVDEALTNAMVHGNGSDVAKFVDVEGVVDADCVRVRIEDEGAGFDPSARKNPLDPDRLVVPGGRGLFLIESVMDEVRYTRGGRCVELVKWRLDGGSS